jgi:hypothetical protein
LILHFSRILTELFIGALTAYFETFQASFAVGGVNKLDVFVPGHVYFTNDMVRAIINAFPASFAFAGIEFYM